MLELKGHGRRVRALRYLSESTLITGAEGGECRLWDITSARTIERIPMPKQTIQAIAWHEERNWLAFGLADRSLILAEMDVLQKPRLIPTGHTGPITAVEFIGSEPCLASGAGFRVNSTPAGEVLVHKRESAKSHRKLCELRTGGHGVYDMTAHPNRRQLAIARKLCVVLWSPDEDEPERDFDSDRELQSRMIPVGAYPTRVQYSPDGGQLAIATGWTIRLYGHATQQRLLDLEGHSQGVIDMAFTPDSTAIASIARDRGIRLFDVESGDLLNTMRLDQGRLAAIAVSPSGSTLAVASERTVYVLDL